ncbi:hypothetical protein [Metabacillus fastidiosus]|uniref:hypothetical protein n=1 Tax=Metabacillus fastidiosus TaxID=1458 RepID=UPI002DB582A9|nr:hypothetical protein [Metabacillus fastidiosus]MEC2074486.1 hypothetical protein [Metabacillus fastidiosus]
MENTTEYMIKSIKTFDHLELIWVKDEGYMLLDKNNTSLKSLKSAKKDEMEAMKEFDLIVFHYLKDQYYSVG